MKTKTIFLSLFLTLASMGLWAQEKYDYAAVKYEPTGKAYTIYHSDLSGMKSTTGNAKIDDLSPLISYIEPLTNLGWEVFYITEVQPANGLMVTTYHLRKKKN